MERARRTAGNPDPRIARSRALILAAASEHFLRNGYLGANVDQIADEARVSKRTVYNIFGSKEQLFREIVSEALATAERFATETPATLVDTDAAEPALRDVALRLARTVLQPRIVRLRRLLISEAERFPDVARGYYDRAPERTLDMLADALRTFHERGLLRVERPRVAAEHLAFLVIGSLLDRALFTGPDELPSEADIDAHANAGVDAFLRAYPVQRQSRSGGRTPSTR